MEKFNPKNELYDIHKANNSHVYKGVCLNHFAEQKYAEYYCECGAQRFRDDNDVLAKIEDATVYRNLPSKYNPITDEYEEYEI